MNLDLEDIRKVVKDLECEKNQALCENQNLCCEMNNLKDELCRLKRMNQELCDDLECTDANIKQLKQDNCRLEDCIREKDQEIMCLRKLTDEIDRLKAYICQVEKDLECAHRKGCKLEEQIVDLGRCIQEKEMCIRRMENKLAEMEQEICELDNTIKCLTEENDCLNQELEECRCNLQQANQELECMCNRLKQCECAKQKLQEQVCCLQSELEQTHDCLQKEKQCNFNLQSQLKCLQEDNYRLKIENQSLNEDNCDLGKKLDCCNKNMKRCQCENDRAQQEVCELKKCIEQFKRQIMTGIKCSTAAPAISCCGGGADCCPTYMTYRAKSANRIPFKTNNNRRDYSQPELSSSITLFPARNEVKSRGSNKLGAGACAGSTLSTIMSAKTKNCSKGRPRKCNENSEPCKRYGTKKCF